MVDFDLTTVVELSSLASKLILIIEKLYTCNLLFEKTCILFYNNSFSILCYLK